MRLVTSQIRVGPLIVLVALVVAAAVVAKAERASVRTYTIADGLAHNRVSGITRDSRGFLWFCTGDGLSRFDGSRFTNYNIEDGLPITSINSLLETRNGVYWIATNGGGVARLNASVGSSPPADAQSPSRFTVYLMSDNAVTNRVNTMFEDSAGALWAGTDGGLFRMDQTKNEQEFHSVELKIPAHFDLSVQIWSIIDGSDGSLWIATKFGLVHRLGDGRMIHYHIQPGATDNVTSLLRDNDGNILFAHETNIMAFSPKPEMESNAEGRSLTVEPARRYSQRNRPDSRVRILFRSSTGRIWAVETGYGLSAFDGNDFQPY